MRIIFGNYGACAEEYDKHYIDIPEEFIDTWKSTNKELKRIADALHNANDGG